MNKEFTQEEADLHNQLTQNAWAIIDQYIHILDRPTKNVGFWGKRKLQKAIKNFKQAIEIAPNQYASKWGLGKIYQVLDLHKESLMWFEEAYKLEQNNPDVCREATLAAVDSEDYEKAIKYSDASLELAPENAGLHCNRALIFMLMSKDKEANECVEKALELNPEDQITKNVQKIMTDIISGKRNRPKNMKEL